MIRKKTGRAMGKSRLPGVDYTINPYTGCSHGCIYCYSRQYCPRDVGERWGKVVVVKSNIVEVLAGEIRKKPRGRVVLSTLTDPYQPVEREERLTRKLLEVLLNSKFKVGIQTKSDLVLRDLDLLLSHPVDVGFTITTLDESLAMTVEPGAPAPLRRVKALEKLHYEGVKTWIFLGPILPDSGFEDVVEVAKSLSIPLIYDRFRIKPFMNSADLTEIVKKSMRTDWRKVSEKIEKMYSRAIPAFRR
ncbi:SPL family radical SAM protein [Archaeoglobus neptunius]|uniref:SPL family radical SAM protein n=1 Tax=Archaeoglobus neptunius TaxID=2798580 RepID=UPI002EDB617E